MVGIETLHRLAGRLVPGEKIWARDWDICCISTVVVSILGSLVGRGDVEALLSPAATSRTWFEETFQGRDCSRVGYITGNPFAAELDDDVFGYFHLEPVTETKDGIETVPPAALTEVAVAAWRERDRLGIDQLVVHYMQPHIPFRGRPDWFSQYRGSDTWGLECWANVGEEYDREEWFAAYRDNPGGHLTLGFNRFGKTVTRR